MHAIDVGLLILRLSVGLTFFGHGAQKDFGWWKGAGFETWTAGMARQGLRPPRFWATVGAGIELICGPLLALGLLTSVAAAFLVAQSAYIVARAHWPRGFWNRDGGIEFPLQMLAASLLFAASGPGLISLDAALGIGFSRELRVAFLVVANAGAIVAYAIPRVLGPPPPEQPPRAA